MVFSPNDGINVSWFQSNINPFQAKNLKPIGRMKINLALNILP